MVLHVSPDFKPCQLQGGIFLAMQFADELPRSRGKTNSHHRVSTVYQHIGITGGKTYVRQAIRRAWS